MNGVNTWCQKWNQSDLLAHISYIQIWYVVIYLFNMNNTMNSQIWIWKKKQLFFLVQPIVNCFTFHSISTCTNICFKSVSMYKYKHHKKKGARTLNAERWPFVIERQVIKQSELWRPQKAYHTGVAFPTDISWKPSPRMPSNFATMKVRPGSFVASINS